MSRLAAALLLSATMALPVGALQSARADAGRIVVSLIGRPIGTEVYQRREDAAGTHLTAEMDLVERGGRLRLSSSIHLGPDLTPIAYQSRGQTYRFVNVDLDVAVTGRHARVRRQGQETVVDVPERFFVADTYAPIAARASLIAYWQRHGRPARLAVVSGGLARDVTIEDRGVDRVRVAGRDVRLRRYAVDNIVWGREAVWLDEAGRFAAMTSRIHILPLEAVREDLREALPALLSASVADRMADLERLGRSVTPVARGAFAIVGARVIDGTGAAPTDDAVIVVRDGRIGAVGPRATTRVPAGVRVIDGVGTTVMPGLWDLHAHASQIEWAPAYLAAGVTTVRDMGGEFGFLTALRDAIASGRGVGPRLLLAGLVDGDADRALGAVVAATPDDGRAVVDRYKAAGFAQIKLYSLLDADVARAIISRAHEVGLTVTGHVPASLGLDGAIAAGMDHIAHAPGAARDLAARLADRRVVVDPTMPWGELLGYGPDTPIASFEPAIDRLPVPLRQNYLSVRNQTDAAAFAARQRSSRALVKALFDAGVPIVVGTDGAAPGVSVLRNLEQLVEAGLTPMQAIQAATLVPARAMGLAHESGTLEAGRRADLLVLDANPLDDIRHVRRSRWVAAAGVLYRTSDWEPVAGFSAPQAPTSESIPWSADRRLEWRDFKARPQGRLQGALSALSYTISVGCREGTLQAAITAVFSPDQSWVADRIVQSGLASRIGLRHEQLHFDIKELYARKIRRMFAELERPCPQSDDQLHALTLPLRREELAAQSRVERDTRGGELERPQLEWETRVAAELKALDAYR